MLHLYTVIWLKELAKKAELFKSKFKADIPSLPLLHTMRFPDAVEMDS